MSSLRSLLLAALGVGIAVAPAAPVRSYAERSEERRPGGDERAPGEDEPQRAACDGRVVLRPDGPHEHQPDFGTNDLGDCRGDAPGVRARRLPARRIPRPPARAILGARVRAGLLSLPPPMA